MDADCLVCRELRGEIDIPGGFLEEDRVVLAFHVPPLAVEVGDPSPYLGHLLIVTRRHAPRLGDLTDDEAAAVGRAAARLARALIDVGGAEWVYSAVIGTGTPHFHLHLVPRYPGTPPDVPWYAVDEWEGAPRADADEIAALGARLKASLGS
ncbi:MAG TPA: HIT family protein [Gaiellaceae bacterium]|nr:HIT family protein [Gaiellaceae bacterium]